MNIEKIALIASSKASKPTIIIETIMKFNMLAQFDFKFVVLTDSDKGQFVEFCYIKGFEVVVLEDVKNPNKADLKIIKDKGCDVLISLGWPYKIPIYVLCLFKAAINCHGSILPDYRGSYSYMHYYANCEPYYGASIHYMNDKLDDGKVLIQAGYRRRDNEDNNDMQVRTAELCAFLLPQALRLLMDDYEGFEPEGKKRYFFKRTNDEFQFYHNNNVKALKEGLQLTLTPNKEL